MSASSLVQLDTYELPSLDHPGFKKLRIDHRKVIYLHLQGTSNVDIARAMGRSSAWVGNTLRNPTVVPILDALYNDYDVELKGMTGLAVEAIRESLEDGDPGEKLKAADLLFKRQGAYNKVDHSDNNAEAVIARFLAEIENVRVEQSPTKRLLLLGGDQEDTISVAGELEVVDA